MKIAHKLLQRYSEEGDEILQHIFAIEEAWIRSFESELKWQSSECYTKNSPRPVKFCQSQNCAKMLMIFVYDVSRVLTTHRVPFSEAVNNEYYKKYVYYKRTMMVLYCSPEQTALQTYC